MLKKRAPLAMGGADFGSRPAAERHPSHAQCQQRQHRRLGDGHANGAPILCPFTGGFREVWLILITIVRGGDTKPIFYLRTCGEDKVFGVFVDEEHIVGRRAHSRSMFHSL